MVPKAAVPGDDIIHDGAKGEMVGDGRMHGAEPRRAPLREDRGGPVGVLQGVDADGVQAGAPFGGWGARLREGRARVNGGAPLAF